MTISGIENAGSHAAAISGKSSQRAQTGNFQNALSSVSGKNTTYVLHGQSEAAEGETAVLSWVDTQTNTSYGFYKPTDFDPENPSYLVREWDANGNMTERTIDVSKIDPKNCDAVELHAYCAYLQEKGISFQDSVMKASTAVAAARAEQRQGQSFSADDYLTAKTDWLEIARKIMGSQKAAGNWKGFLEWGKFLSALEK